ncbi:hypothetical protein ACFLUO_02440 [Chloroflexota bacterium]
MSNIRLLYTAVIMLLLSIVVYTVGCTVLVGILSVIPPITITNKVALASELRQGGEDRAKVYEHILNGEYQ